MTNNTKLSGWEVFAADWHCDPSKATQGRTSPRDLLPCCFFSFNNRSCFAGIWSARTSRKFVKEPGWKCERPPAPPPPSAIEPRHVYARFQKGQI